MKFQSFKFLTDENIDVEVFDFLVEAGLDVFDIKKKEKWGMSDAQILEMAHDSKRVVISQDSDFCYFDFS